MKRFLIVVDMQKDFVVGALGTPEAQQIVPRVVEKIRGFEGEIIITYDTHEEDYMETREGRFLPVPHCIRDTAGWQLNAEVTAALEERAYTVVEKPTFGAVTLPEVVEQLAGDEEFTVELVGLCTDICVVSNALLLKARLPETKVRVAAACCAGVTPASHAAALETMKMCQVELV